MRNLLQLDAPLNPTNDNVSNKGESPRPDGRRSLKSWVLGRRVSACPQCGSTYLRLSQKATARGGLVVYRCRTCKTHFKAISPKSGVWARVSLIIFLLISAGVLASFLLRGPAGPGNESPTLDAAKTGDFRQDPVMAKIASQAKRGDPESEYYMGWANWQRGEYSRALPWLTKAATHGHIEANHLLAIANLKGRGTIQNYREAEARFKQAAEAGHLESQYQLGLMLRDGLAHLPDKENAYVWLNVAAARGHEDALLFRDKLATAMTTDELVRAQETSSQMHNRLGSPPP